MYQWDCFLLKKAVLLICGSGRNYCTVMDILILYYG